MFNTEQSKKGNLLTDPEITFTSEKSLYSFISKIMLDEEIDFVAGPVISHWHAIGIDALAYSIFQHENREPSGVIIVIAHPQGGLLISEADFVCKNFATVKFCFLHFSSGTYEPVICRGIRFIKRGMSFLLAMLAIKGNIRGKDKGEKRKVYIASVMHPQLGLLQIFRNKCLADKYYPTFALIDEGISTYMPGKVWEAVSILDHQRRYLKHPEVLQRAGIKVMRIISKLLEIIAAKYINAENLFLFEHKGDKLFLNKSVANLYKGVLRKRGKANLMREQTKPLALIVTQPLSEYGQVSLALELDLIQTVISILVKTGYSVVLKPHPREAINKYAPVLTRFETEQVELVQQKMPVEEFFPNIPTCVIGYTSTSLVTANALYGIPAVTIIDILLDTGANDELINMSAELFKKMTEEMVYKADTFDKLDNILNSIKSK